MEDFTKCSQFKQTPNIFFVIVVVKSIVRRGDMCGPSFGLLIGAVSQENL